MKVALVYDRVNKIGGAERVLLALHEIWPEAPLFTSVYDVKGAPWAKVFPQIMPSFLQHFPFAKKHHELYGWFMPLAFESFRFDDYDLVISVTSEAAKGIITKPQTTHLCYCLTPTRYLWQSYDDYFKNKLFKFLSQPFINYLRKWDKIASQRPDFMIAVSNNVAERIKKYYGREAEVIYPPINLTGASPTNFSIASTKTDSLISGHSTTANLNRDIAVRRHSKIVGLRPLNDFSDYFLIVSRLVPYKRIDLAIEAFSKLGLPLKIVGSGMEEGKLKTMAKPNIEFLGQNLTDAELLAYYQNCRALIFPGEEDLGLVSLEAQLCGKPVLAYKKGGALETVISGVTGEFFYPQTSEALIKAIRHFDPKKYKIDNCCQNAQKFTKERFKEKFMAYILRCLAIQLRGLTK